MTITLTTPAAVKLRSASRRRFVVVVDTIDDVKSAESFIEKRSDNLDTLRTHVQRKGFANFYATSKSFRHIMDTTTGKVVGR